MTNQRGQYNLRTSHVGAVVLLVERIGLAPARVTLTVDAKSTAVQTLGVQI